MAQEPEVSVKLLLDDFDRTVIVAVITMRMVKTSVDNVVDVVAVGDGFVAAIGTVHVAVFVLSVVDVGATVWIRFGHRKDMLVDRAVVILVMKMTVMEVIDMIAVLDGGVAAPFPVLMLVIFLGDMLFAHNG